MVSISLVPALTPLHLYGIIIIIIIIIIIYYYLLFGYVSHVRLPPL